MLSPDVDKRVQEWLNSPIDEQSKAEIQRLMREDPQTLSDAFYTTLSFGTGGMRGIMGVGTNRMNLYTIQMATQGLANYLLQHPSIRERHHVFISYDSRHNSRDFALMAARVLAANDIGSYLTCDLRPTPFVSFGVRQKECSAGIMITASHNPKEYNGYKVYWSDGGQVVAPHDTGIVEEVKKISSFDQVKIAQENSMLIELIDPELDVEYLETIQKLQIDPKEDKQVGDRLKITYTPLHGTGGTLVPKALNSWGFSNINPVDHQLIPDGNFPTVESPNPENKEALQMGIEQMQNTLSDIFIATDPDADRMAVVALHKDAPYILNGNQIAIICLEYICQMHTQKSTLPPNGAAVTTIVSTDLLAKICKNYHISCFEVLTGFKYIGEKIHQWEQDHSHTFLFGAEESYGYLIGTHSRDKDAVVASCLIAEIALLMNVEGKTLVDFLKDIYKKYGLFLEKQRVLSFPPGQEGMEKMQSIMHRLRTESINRIGDQSIILREDYASSLHGLPKSDVLLFRLEDESKIVIRPSGTEPKLKIYAAVHEPTFTTFDEGMQVCESKIQKLLDAVEILL